MKKTILTIMVAAMMLVAFTACEQAPVDVNGYVPSDLSISYNGTGVLVGQPFDPADFSGTITYKNGQTAPYTGTFALVDPSKTDAYAKAYGAGNNTVVAVISSSAVQSGIVEATCNVVGYKPQSMTLSNLPATVKQNGTLDLTGSTLTVTYADNQTAALSWDEKEFTLAASPTTSGTVGTDIDVTVSGLYLYGTGENYNTMVADLDWSVEIVAAETTAADVVSIQSISLKDGVNVYYGGNALQADGKTSAELKKTDFVVVGLTADNEEVELDSTDYTITYASDIKKTLGAVTLEVSPVASKTTFEAKVFDNAFTVREDLTTPAIANFEVELDKDESYQITDADILSHISAKVASTSADVTTGFTIESVSSRLISASENTSKTISVTFSWSGNGNSKTYSDSVTVTINRASN